MKTSQEHFESCKLLLDCCLESISMISRLSKTSYKSAILIVSFLVASYCFFSFRFFSFLFVSFLKRFLHVNMRKTCTVYIYVCVPQKVIQFDMPQWLMIVDEW